MILGYKNDKRKKSFLSLHSFLSLKVPAIAKLDFGL